MDRLKPAIEWCKKNIFWIGCFFLAATMIGSWVFSSMQLAADQKTRQSDIEKQVKAIEQVAGTTAEPELDQKAHPNDATKAGMDAENNTTISSIVRAWKKRYEKQKSILAWPEDVLGKETCDFFSKIDVPEKVTDPGQGFEKYRKQYYDNIPEFMVKICRNVGVNWQYDEEEIARKQREQEETAASASDSGDSGSVDAAEVVAVEEVAVEEVAVVQGGAITTNIGDELNRYPVIWDQNNQVLWHRKLKEFLGYDDHSGTILYPTFMQANMLQQDLGCWKRCSITSNPSMVRLRPTTLL